LSLAEWFNLRSALATDDNIARMFDGQASVSAPDMMNA